MQDYDSPTSTTPRRAPWNKGKLIGAKAPLLPKHVWLVRTKLQVAVRTRDLAMFNLAIDSKLRACDIIALKIETLHRADTLSIARTCDRKRRASRSGSS